MIKQWDWADKEEIKHTATIDKNEVLTKQLFLHVQCSL